MNWFSKLLGSRAKNKADEASEATQPLLETGDAATRTYNDAVRLFTGGDYPQAERLFLSVSADGKVKSMRIVAAGAAGICRLRRGASLAADLYPADLQNDANGLLVAFLAVNLAALQMQQGRQSRVRADGLTWYVNTKIAGCQYEFRIINMFGNTVGQAFRVDAGGKFLYLPDLEQDPDKASLLIPSDPEMSLCLTNNIKVGPLRMATLPSTGLSSMLTEDNYSAPRSDVGVTIKNYD